MSKNDGFGMVINEAVMKFTEAKLH